MPEIASIVTSDVKKLSKLDFIKLKLLAFQMTFSSKKTINKI